MPGPGISSILGKDKPSQRYDPDALAIRRNTHRLHGQRGQRADWLPRPSRAPVGGHEQAAARRGVPLFRAEGHVRDNYLKGPWTAYCPTRGSAANAWNGHLRVRRLANDRSRLLPSHLSGVVAHEAAAGQGNPPGIIWRDVDA